MPDLWHHWRPYLAEYHPLASLPIQSSKTWTRDVPIFLVTTSKEEAIRTNMQSLFHLDNVKITVEDYKHRGPKRCFRCQQIFHSSLNYNMPYCCIKCGENHDSCDCKKDKSLSATCCNCGSEHRVCHSKCPANRKKSKPINVQKITKIQGNNPSIPILNNGTWWNTLFPKKEKIQPPNPNLNLGDFQNLTNNMNIVLSKLTKISHILNSD